MENCSRVSCISSNIIAARVACRRTVKLGGRVLAILSSVECRCASRASCIRWFIGAFTPHQLRTSPLSHLCFPARETRHVAQRSSELRLHCRRVLRKRDNLMKSSSVNFHREFGVRCATAFPSILVQKCSQDHFV